MAIILPLIISENRSDARMHKREHIINPIPQLDCKFILQIGEVGHENECDI